MLAIYVAFSSLTTRNRAKCLLTVMASISKALLMQCRIALGLTQKEFANMFGRAKRTIQRWEDRGTTMLPSEIEVLTCAIHPVRPDLAEQVATAGGTTLAALGIGPARGSIPPAISDRIESVVSAAARVMGKTPDSVRAGVAAAFARAHDLGLDVKAVSSYLRTTIDP